MKKQFLSLGLMLLSGAAMAQTSHWTQSFNAVSGQSFNRVALFQGFNDNPGNPPFAVTSIFTVGQTQHSQVGAQVIPAVAQPRYSWGGNAFQVATGINAVKIYGFDVYPNPALDDFSDEVWIAGHRRNSSPGTTAQYARGTIQRKVLNVEINFTELRLLDDHQFFDISINKSFGGQGVVAVGRATPQNQAFITVSTDNGANWTDYEHATTEQVQLNAVKYASENVIYAVGGTTSGTIVPVILKSTDGGANWVELSVGLSGIGTLNDLAVAGADNVWAVGTNGKIIHTDNGGASWSEQTSNNTENLLSIFFLDAQKGWLAGGNGTIMKTTNGGQTWIVSPINSTLHFADIAFVNEDEGVVIAQNGTIFSYIGCSPVTGNLTVDGPSSLCADGQATYTIQIGQQNVTDYIWEYNGGTGTLTNGSVTITAPAEGQGNPTLTIYGSNECSQGSQFAYAPSVVGTPPPFTITGNANACAGNFLAYSVEPTGIPVTWDFPNGWVQNTTFPNNNGGQFTAGESGTISFTRDNGCFTRTETLEVTVAQSAPAAAVLASSTMLCPNEATVISINLDQSATGSQFLFPLGWTYAPDTDTSFTVTAFGNAQSATVTHQSSNVCGTTEAQFTFTKLTETINYSGIYDQDGVLYVLNPASGVGHQWLLDGNPINGANGTSYQPLTNGAYSVQSFYIDYACEPHIGNVIDVTFVGVNEVASLVLKVYPNPATTSFTLSGLAAGNTITLTDATGRTVRTSVAGSSQTEVSLNGIRAGIYAVSVTSGAGTSTGRLVVY